MRDQRAVPPCPAPSRCRNTATHLPGRAPREKPEVATAAARPGPKELRGRAGRARPIHYPALCLRRRRGAEQLPRLGRRGRGAQARGAVLRTARDMSARRAAKWRHPAVVLRLHGVPPHPRLGGAPGGPGPDTSLLHKDAAAGRCTPLRSWGG